MSPLAGYARTRTDLRRSQIEHLERLVATWRIISDLSFSDLLLVAPLAHEDGHRFVVLGQQRPTTGQTVYPTDLVGTVIDEVERPLLARAWQLGEIVEGDTQLLGERERDRERLRTQIIPVRSEGQMIALVTRDSWTNPGRRTGDLERAYLDVYDSLSEMIAEGSFPFPSEEVEAEEAPRISDGVIIVDPDTRIFFASPNAISSLHRMGIHAYASGCLLRDVGFDDDAVTRALEARLPVLQEVERGDVSILLRVTPLLEGGENNGALIMLRDVSALRRRDRMLMSKDATIREIHHRVKNNLQTIASLLRLQGRRLKSREAYEAIRESERRIRSIAIVHETLSHDASDVVAFGDIVRPLVRIVEETLSSPEGSPITIAVHGDAGELRGETATAVAVVLNELMQNAADHAFGEGEHRRGGHIDVTLERGVDEVRIEVRDDGRGLPPDFSLEGSKGLGLSIVHALVTGELGGSIEMRHDHGTVVTLTVPVASTEPADAG